VTASAATTPPADAQLPPRSAHATPPGEPLPRHYGECYVCGEQAGGLGLRTVAGEGLSVNAHFTVQAAHQGAPGLIHGGLLAAAFDEVLGALNWVVGKPAVTARLETDFRAPVPVGSVVDIVARVEGVSGRKVYGSAVAYIVDGAQPVLVAEAAALFIQVPLEHFTTHGTPEYVARARDAADPGRSALLSQFELNP
jgi:acyl-coenzyme A thioesterase PaaI-like protein